MKLCNSFVPQSNKYPLIASLPHSGTHIPKTVLKQFRRGIGPLICPVDWHLDRLFDFLPELEIATIQATHSRYLVNLNRNLDEPLFGSELSCVIPERTTFRKKLYDRQPDRSEIDVRIKKYYEPYHRCLKQMVWSAVNEHNRAYLVDLHSFISGPKEDICLGNVNETTCSERFIGCFEKTFKKHGFNVTRNDKWTGGYITQYYGAMENVESLQIEIRLPVYLEGNDFMGPEAPDRDTDRFRNAGKRLRKVFNDVLSDLF